MLPIGIWNLASDRRILHQPSLLDVVRSPDGIGREYYAASHEISIANNTSPYHRESLPPVKAGRGGREGAVGGVRQKKKGNHMRSEETSGLG